MEYKYSFRKKKDLKSEYILPMAKETWLKELRQAQLAVEPILPNTRL